jgi:dCMP deaminase
MKPKFISAYMDVAERFAQLSTATRAKVGAIIVKDNRIISIGYNGMPSGWTNECEHKEYMPVDAGGWLDAEDILEQWPYTEEVEVDDGEFVKGPDHEDRPGVFNPGKWTPNGKKKVRTRRYRMKSNPEVLHAETNALAKVARSPESAEGATLFCTHLPCIDCAKLIYQSGISEVYYRVEYQAAKGVGKEFLEKSGVIVQNV